MFTGVSLVLASALFHAVWNAFLKKAESKNRFNFLMHVASVVVFTLLLVTVYREYIVFDSYIIVCGLISGFFFAIYHVLVARAYTLADVSQVYPITTSSPIFVTVWAMLILNEKISLMGMTGILITIFGCFILNYVHGSGKKFTINAGVIAAFLSAFAYSFGAIIDKLGVNTGNSVMYTYAMNTFMTIYLGILYYAKYRHEPKSTNEGSMIWIAAVVVVASSLLYRFGIEDIYVSYGIAVRQASGIFGLVIGILFFKEGYGRIRFVGTLTIILGIAILALM